MCSRIQQKTSQTDKNLFALKAHNKDAAMDRNSNTCTMPGGGFCLYIFLNLKRWIHYYPTISWVRKSRAWLFYKIKMTTSLEKQLPGNSDERVVFRFIWSHVCLFWFFCGAHFLHYNQKTEQFWDKNSTYKKNALPWEDIFITKYSLSSCSWIALFSGLLHEHIGKDMEKCINI